MFDFIKSRRSIRKFKETKIEQEKINILSEALLRAPTSKSTKSTEIIITQEKNLIEQIAQARITGSEFLKNSTTVITVIGNPEKTDVWVEYTSIAAAYIQLLAHSMNLGSCWVQIRNRNKDDYISSEKFIKELLNIPENLNVLCCIGLGYPDEIKNPIPDEKLNFDRIKKEVYK